ncbi:MAG TPA: hypothetical protein DCY42_12090 [Chloroflexi bacterium]|nr:hypothetical protein [Chloroflexota bacterium]
MNQETLVLNCTINSPNFKIFNCAADEGKFCFQEQAGNVLIDFVNSGKLPVNMIKSGSIAYICWGRIKQAG